MYIYIYTILSKPEYLAMPEIHQWGSAHSRPAPKKLHLEYQYNCDVPPLLVIKRIIASRILRQQR